MGSIAGLAVLGLVMFGPGLFPKEALRTPPPAAPAPVAAVEEPKPAPVVTPFNPEDQPRTTYVREFKGVEKLPEGFKLDGLVLTANGIELPPPAPGATGTRKGTATSPNEYTEFPGNSFAPLWRQRLADGTRVDAEFALSPDGKTWGPWTQIIADDEAHGEISPTYPDGSPNPFHGFQPGGLFNYGDERWAAFRYRFVLTSENAASPVLEAVRFFYQDSTLGEGVGGKVESLEKLASQLAPVESESQPRAP